MHYLLFYEVAGDYLSRRGDFREAHLEKAWAASERGELVLGGALANPVDGAVLLFRGDSPEVAEKFAAADPYVTSGLVKRWHVREWTTVAGEASATPIRPKALDPEKPTKAFSPADNRSERANNGMIMRFWKARSTVQASDKYVEHATEKVFPALDQLDGHRGAYLLRRAVDDAVEFVVLTFWDSMESVRKFAGVKPERAVVGPEARAVLTSFDETVSHFEVVSRTRPAK
jgi:heme-degrading monooxygenase HmoA/uncharacterized protein YciI